MVNGDVLTQVDYRQMLEFHNDNHADLTVALSLHEVDIPFGVVTCKARPSAASRRSRLSMYVNAGMYLLQPSVCE